MIKQKFLKQIKSNQRCRAQLQIALNKSEQSIKRYLNDNDILLTTTAALTVIKEFTGASEKELLETESA